MRSLISLAVLIVSLVSQYTTAQSYTGPEDSRLEIALTLEAPCNGVSVTPNGRIFLVFQREDGSTGPSIVEYNTTTNTSTPYPNAEWNNYKAGADPASHFIGANAQRIGPDGSLWVVDTGQVGGSGPVILPDGVKVVQINITTGTITRVYPFGDATYSDSHLDDIRFHNATGKAFLTDAGHPGLIVLDLASGETRRVLNDDLSTRGYMPMCAEGHILYTMGAPAYTYADQLEVSPDGEWLYYQPSSGGMNRIQTCYLNDAFYNSSMNDNTVLDQYVQPFALTPPTGGTAIDADGNVYVSDIDSQRVIRIAPNGTMTTLVQDPRLLWVDAMWVDDQHRLWMPADQLNRGTSYNNGTSHIVKPLLVFIIDIGVGPAPIDHA